ncbi:MAG: hypothetical protein E7222_02570 [Clostridiales bacterium]|uniref:hypothetical protein n=1 Tax=Aminipila sp. TaxID=2060095 RepID=UPI001D8595BD|nr:hypothetical protein [Aminipila sp.]MBE6033564.1 hypothetical protein [Clostridiales bacterium]
MRINTLNVSSKSANYKRAMHQKSASDLLGVQTKSKESRVDTFIRSNRGNSVDALSESKAKMLDGMVGNDILDVFNFEEVIPCSDGIYTYKGVSFTGKQIPKVDSSRCKEIKAENNVVTFQKNSYYKYTTKDGIAHCMASGENSLNTSYSDAISGNTDNISHLASWFWEILSSKESVYIGLHYSEEEQKQYLDDAGVKKGFFTVQVGDSKATHYYSNADVAIRPKWHYDERYKAMTTGGLLIDNQPGDVFVVDGKEYILSENRTLDVPYGADIFDIEYPHMRELKNNQ